MRYKTYSLQEYNLTVDIGVITSEETAKFLAGLSAPKGEVSKQEYEDFILSRLIKDYSDVVTFEQSLPSDKEQRLVRYQLLDMIYTQNPKLKPQQLCIIGDKIHHQSDAIKLKLKSVSLQFNARWLDSVSVKSLLNPNPIKKIVDKITVDVKSKLPGHKFIPQAVELIDSSIPILQVASTTTTADQILYDYIQDRCDGNLELAKSSLNSWKGHVIGLTVPYVEELVSALTQGGYIGIYTDSLIITKLYLAVVAVNPDLEWGSLNWSLYDTPSLPIEPEPPKKDGLYNNWRPPSFIKGIRPVRPQELQSKEDKKRFSDLGAATILGLKAKMKQRIFGQDNAIDSLVDAIAVARVGLRGDQRPIGSFLLPGPTGVGKTETAKALADELGAYLCVCDCSEYQQPHEISKLFGAPPGYVGFEDYSRPGSENLPPATLAAKVKENPFCVVLFDELEKADPAIFNVLLQIMDEGRITSGRGEVIKFPEAVVLLTSNVGTKEASDACSRNTLGFSNIEKDLGKIESEVIERSIKSKFNPEFLNRLTDILHYKKLSKEACIPIVNSMLAKTKENLEKAQHLSLQWDNDVEQYILDLGYSDEYGARNLSRTIQKEIELPLAEWILKNRYLVKKDKIKGDTVSVFLSQDKIDFKEELINDKKKVNNKEGGLSGSDDSTPRRSREGSCKT